MGHLWLRRWTEPPPPHSAPTGANTWSERDGETDGDGRLAETGKLLNDYAMTVERF